MKIKGCEKNRMRGPDTQSVEYAGDGRAANLGDFQFSPTSWLNFVFRLVFDVCNRCWPSTGRQTVFEEYCY